MQIVPTQKGAQFPSMGANSWWAEKQKPQGQIMHLEKQRVRWQLQAAASRRRNASGKRRTQKAKIKDLLPQQEGGATPDRQLSSRKAD